MICFFVWFCGKWTYALEVLQCSVRVLKKWRKNRARCLWKGRGTELFFTISTGFTRPCLVFFWSFCIFSLCNNFFNLSFTLYVLYISKRFVYVLFSNSASELSGSPYSDYNFFSLFLVVAWKARILSSTLTL